MEEPVLTKTCRDCGQTKTLDKFDFHPTCSHQRKSQCKECFSVYNRSQYNKKLAALGKSRVVKKSTFLDAPRYKKGHTREDGLVLVSTVRRGNKYQEWWVPPEKYEQIRKKQLEKARFRYHNDPVYRERERAENTSEVARARKRRWNKENRRHLELWQAERRAKVKGNHVMLTEAERKRVSEFYQFRDILNGVHGKPVFEVDHIKPIARGGLHHPDNLRVTTGKFNRRKFVNVLCPETWKKIGTN